MSPHSCVDTSVSVCLVATKHAFTLTPTPGLCDLGAGFGFGLAVGLVTCVNMSSV